MTLTVTRTRTHTYIQFADPHLVCVGCGQSVTEFHAHERCGCGDPGMDRHDCGAIGVRDTCPSWGPVDGCQCADLLGEVPHPRAAT